MADSHALYVGDALEVLRTLPSESVHCCITSPPYYGLRDYGVKGQIGLERTPEEYIERLVAVFREVRRVLRGDGTLWVNIGDSYAGHHSRGWRPGNEVKNGGASNRNGIGYVDGLKPKDLIGIPWALAFALRADGWYLRQDIIWHKPAPMPESVKDRCTRAHEYIFHLSKSRKYYHDAAAIAEPGIAMNEHDATGTGWQAPGQAPQTGTRTRRSDKQRGHSRRHAGFNDRWDAMEKKEQCSRMRNKRSVWQVGPSPCPEAHFAVYPIEIPETCLLAGCPPGGVVLDPFTGAGTTWLACLKNGRDFIGVELNPEYIEICYARAGKFYPLLASIRHFQHSLKTPDPVTEPLLRLPEPIPFRGKVEKEAGDCK